MQAGSLRSLSPTDVDSVRSLCEECFPIRYSDSWFTYITSNQVYSLASFTDSGEIKGMLVAELQPLSQLEGEIGPVLESPPRDALAMYIISLGVRSQFRQKGLGSCLVKTLLNHVSHLERCKVVYLHVLASNNPAVELYCRHGFKELQLIEDYYVIASRPAPGLVYCYYSNNSLPFSASLSSYFRRYVCESVLCECVLLCGGVCQGAALWLVDLLKRNRRKHFTF